MSSTFRNVALVVLSLAASAFARDPRPGEIDELLRLLDSEDRNERYNAIMDLGIVGTGEGRRIVPALTRMLKDKDGGVRSLCVRTLQDFARDAEPAVPSLAALQETEEGYYSRSQAFFTSWAIALAVPKARASVASGTTSLLRKLRSNPAARERREEFFDLILLLRWQAHPLVDGLVDILNDAGDDQRHLAAECLASIGRRAAPVLPHLRRLLKDRNVLLRVHAAEAIATIDAPDAAIVQVLIDALRGHDIAARKRAFRAIRSIGPAAARTVPALVELLGDPSSRTRCSVALTLEDIGPDAWPAVSKLSSAIVKDGDWEVRSWAARALKVIASDADESVAAAIAGLNDPEDTVRRRCMDSLASAGPAALPAAPALARMLDDRNPDIRELAAETLAKIGSSAKDVLPQIRKALQEELIGRSGWSAVAAMDPKDPRPVPALIELFKEDISDWRTLSALGELGPAARPAVPELVRAMRTCRDENDRAVIAKTLYRIDPANRDPLPVLEELLREDQDVVGLIRCYGPAAKHLIPTILLAFHSEYGSKIPYLRREICIALPFIAPEGSPEVLSALIGRLSDEDPSVRSTAAQALAKLGPAARGASDALRKSADDDDPDAAEDALLALGRVDPGNAVTRTRLLKALADRSTIVGRRRAADAIEQLARAGSNEDYLPAVLRGLAADPDAEVRIALSSALRFLEPKNKAAVEVLCEIVRSGELVGQRRRAAELLGELGPTAATATPVLQSAARDTSLIVRRAAAEAVERIRRLHRR